MAAKFPRRSFGESSSRLSRACHPAGSAPAPKPPKPEDKNKPPKPPVCQRVILGTDGGVYQSYGAGKAGTISIAFPRASFIGFRSTTRSRFIASQADCRITKTFVGPSRCRAKKVFAIPTGSACRGRWLLRRVRSGRSRRFLCGKSGGLCLPDQFAQRRAPRIAPGTIGRPAAIPVSLELALIGSRHKPGMLYLGGNCVFRLTNRAEKYSVISPDLTHNDPAKNEATGSGAENFGVVFSLAESPKRAGMLWAGTDDGRLWITENDGGNWTELTANLPEPVRGQWIVRIEPGKGSECCLRRDECVSSRGRSADDSRTADLGKTWQRITGDLPANYPLEVVREDPVNPKLLYAGTHFGLFGRSIRASTGSVRSCRQCAWTTLDSSAHIRSCHRNARPQRRHSR